MTRPNEWAWVTDEMFEAAVREIAAEEDSGDILDIPGVWEIVSEHYNNQALDRLRDRADLHLAGRETETRCGEPGPTTSDPNEVTCSACDAMSEDVDEE